MEFIAHRGLSGAAPENSATAFSLGMDRGLRWTELDVLFTADDVAVVCHDDHLLRFGHDLHISESLWADLSDLDMGSWSAPEFSAERMLTLTAAIKLLAGRQTGVNIELKSELFGQLGATRSQALTQCVQQALKGGLRLVLSSFDPRLVGWCRTHCPEVPRAVLVEGPFAPAHEQLAELVGASAIHLEDPHTSMKDVHRVRNMGLDCRVYTINDVERATELAGWGCDGIFTDILVPGDLN